jgi:hypothetical protein
VSQLDPVRQRRAGQRARAAAEEQDYHERQAATAKAKVQSLCDIWNLDPVTFQPKEEAGHTD